MPTMTLWIVVALSAALLWLYVIAPRRDVARDALLRLAWMSAVGALVGGRIAYAVDHFDYFRTYPLHLLGLHRAPGLGGEGAWLGAMVAAWLWHRATHYPWRRTVALLAPPLLLLSAAGWWACAEVGCGWGRIALRAPSVLRLIVVSAPDLYHTVMPRYAVQVLKAGGMLLLAAIALRERWSAAALMVAWLWSALLTALQGDPQLTCAGVRLDALVALLMVAGLGVSLFRSIRV